MCQSWCKFGIAPFRPQLIAGYTNITPKLYITFPSMSTRRHYAFCTHTIIQRQKEVGLLFCKIHCRLRKKVRRQERQSGPEINQEKVLSCFSNSFATHTHTQAHGGIVHVNLNWLHVHLHKLWTVADALFTLELKRHARLLDAVTTSRHRHSHTHRFW